WTASKAPSTAVRGAPSPPMPSTAIGTVYTSALSAADAAPGSQRVVDGEDLATAVAPTRGAHPMRRLGLTAGRTHRTVRLVQGVVRPALVAAGLRMASLGIRHRRVLLGVGLASSSVATEAFFDRFQRGPTWV